MIYCAIIGDIVKSRMLTERQAVQAKLKRVVRSVNKKYDKVLASNFTVTLGDEFQGLLLDPIVGYEIIKLIKSAMSPIQLVFGLGLGEMFTDFRKSISIGSDGPAYYHARNMLIRAKKKKPSICFCSESPEDELINSLMFFIESCVNGRSRKQVEVVKLYEEHKSQYKVAEILNVNQATIYKILDKAFYSQTVNSEEQIRRFLRIKYHTEYNVTE